MGSMPDKSAAVSAPTTPTDSANSPLELAQVLAQQLAIAPHDWHRLNRNRAIRAQEQVATALVYLLKDQPEEALVRLQQAIGWLDKTLQAPPCPTHGAKAKQSPD